ALPASPRPRATGARSDRHVDAAAGGWLAPIMGWERSGDRVADRDAHHASVRRWLDLLQALGLIGWQAGINDAGEEARTEITLLAVAAVDVDAGEPRAAGSLRVLAVALLEVGADLRQQPLGVQRLGVRLGLGGAARPGSGG